MASLRTGPEAAPDRDAAGFDAARAERALPASAKAAKVKAEEGEADGAGTEGVKAEGPKKAGLTKVRPKKAGAKKARARKAAKTASRSTATADVEVRIGYKFNDPALLTQAITHVSALRSGRSRADSYQRLEFLGDHVLGLIVSDMLFHAFPNADEGELSKRLAELVRKESCADVARALGLVDDVKLGVVGLGIDARLRRSVLGDVCEAVIGAIYLDAGHEAAVEFVERNWTERMAKPRRPLRDPKTVLQEWAQGQGLPAPVYREVERSGPHHDPKFRVAVDLPGLAPAEGVGGSKRAAEKVAASAMIEREGVGNDNDA